MNTVCTACPAPQDPQPESVWLAMGRELAALPDEQTADLWRFLDRETAQEPTTETRSYLDGLVGQRSR